MVPITRKALNPNLQITVDDKTYTYEDIISFTNQAKTYFLSNGAKVGKTVLLLAPWPKFVSWFIAGAELGLIFVVADPTSSSYKDILKLYRSVDFIIEDPELISAAYGDIYYSNSRDVLVYTTSSGTTGTPKVIEYTHEFLWSLAKRNAKIYDIKSDDRCVHNNMFTHSSIIGIYFLPTLLACNNHYYFTNNFPEKIRTHKIQYCLVLRDHLDWLYRDFDNNIDYKFKLFVISQIPKEYKLKLINENITMLSIFGSSETMGPVLISTIDYTNYTEEFNNNFGKQLDDYYSVSIDCESFLQVKMPDGRKIVTGDTMYLDTDNNYIFVRRSDRYQINGEVLLLTVLRLYISNILNEDFDLVADEDTDQVYIRLEKRIDLDNLNTALYQKYGDHRYFISKQIIGSRDQYMNNVKLDAHLIRKLCRELN